MDPTRRLVHKTVKIPQTEEEAFNLANAGLVFQYDSLLGNITYDELSSIREYPVVTDYRTYLKIRKMNKDEMLALLPYGSEFFNDLNEAALFRYLSRGINLDRPDMPRMIRRLTRFKEAQLFVQEILLDIYGSLKDYASTYDVHPVEGPLLDYDTNLGLPWAASAAGFQLGIATYDDVELIDRLRYYLKLAKKYTSTFTLKQAISLTIDEFQKKGISGGYHSRLDTVMKAYYPAD